MGTGNSVLRISRRTRRVGFRAPGARRPSLGRPVFHRWGQRLPSAAQPRLPRQGIWAGCADRCIHARPKVHLSAASQRPIVAKGLPVARVLPRCPLVNAHASSFRVVVRRLLLAIRPRAHVLCVQVSFSLQFCARCPLQILLGDAWARGSPPAACWSAPSLQSLVCRML